MILPQEPRLELLRQSLSREEEAGVCLSGGAEGCDLLWGQAAVAAGMHAVHWSFQGHNPRLTSSLQGRLCRLSTQTLELAAPAMEKVARRIGRRLSTRPGVRPLLLRDLFQVAWAGAVYAVSTLDQNGSVAGGTAWAVETFRMKGEGNAYLFCQDRELWFVSTNGMAWTEIEESLVDLPSGIWGGIGTRKPNPAGLCAIGRMAARMRPCTAPSPSN